MALLADGPAGHGLAGGVSASCLTDAHRALALEAGLSPEDVALAWADHVQFKRDNPKSRQTWASCVRYWARQTKLPFARAPATSPVVHRDLTPPKPALWCELHGYRCECPTRVLDTMIGPALARAAETQQREREAKGA